MVGRFSVTPSHRTAYDVFAWLRADSLTNDVDTPHDYQRAAGRLSSNQMLHNDWRHRHFYVNIHETKDRYSRIKGGHWKRIDKRVKEENEWGYLLLRHGKSKELQAELKAYFRTPHNYSYECLSVLRSLVSFGVWRTYSIRITCWLNSSDIHSKDSLRHHVNICWLANDISLT